MRSGVRSNARARRVFALVGLLAAVLAVGIAPRRAEAAGIAPIRAEAALCPPSIAADARLAEVAPHVRLAWIDARLAEGRRTAALWSWSWGLGIGASGVGSLAVVPFVSRGERVDWYTSAASAAVGVIPLVLAPPAVMRDARELRARLTATGAAGEDVCALLADAEARLVRDAGDQRRQRAWWFHAGNVAFNTGITLFLGLGFHHWTGGLINGIAGVVVGEALLLSQPTRTIDDLGTYRAGELGQGSAGAPTRTWVPAWTAMWTPMWTPVSGWAWSYVARF